MELSQQVNTRAQGKRLQGLGVTEPSLFYWWEDEVISRKNVLERFSSQYSSDPLSNWAMAETDLKEGRAFLYPAYTVAELGEMLPYEIFRAPEDLGKGSGNYSPVYGYQYKIWQTRKRIWRFRLPTQTHEEQADLKDYTTEAECRAACLIHLLENKLITLK